MRLSTAIIAVSVAVTGTGTALACGESLFRVGRGVEFREYSAPLPGRIIVVARTDAERAMAERLAAAGHDIHAVADPFDITTEIENSSHEFDLVVALFSQREIVEAATAATTIQYLPVALEGDEEAQARSLYEHYLPDQGSVKRMLRGIHAALRDKEKGRTI